MDRLPALENKFESIDFWVPFAIAAIVIGLVLEYRTELWNSIKSCSIDLKVLGALLVVGGVAAELGLHIWSSNVSTEIRALQKQMLAPRRLDSTLRDQISKKIVKHDNAMVAVSAYGPEALDLAIDAGETFKSLGWEWINWPLPGEAIPLSGRPSIGVQVLDGIDIRAVHPDLLADAKALEEIFQGAGWAKVRVGEPGSARTDNSKVLLIMVGTKP